MGQQKVQVRGREPTISEQEQGTQDQEKGCAQERPLVGRPVFNTLTPQETDQPDRQQHQALAQIGPTVKYKRSDYQDNQAGPARDIVQLNAGGAIYAANITDTLAAGIEKAGQVIASGAARAKLDALIAYSKTS